MQTITRASITLNGRFPSFHKSTRCSSNRFQSLHMKNVHNLSSCMIG